MERPTLAFWKHNSVSLSPSSSISSLVILKYGGTSLVHRFSTFRRCLFLEVPLLLITFCACSSPPVTHELDSEEMRDCREQALVIMKWYLPFADDETHSRNVTKTCIVSIGQDEEDVQAAQSYGLRCADEGVSGGG